MSFSVLSFPHKSITFSRHFSGRSMLEMIAVVSVLGILIAGIFGITSTVFTRRDVTFTLDKINRYVDDIHQAFSWIGTYTFAATGTGTGTVMSRIAADSTKGGNITNYLKKQGVIKDELIGTGAVNNTHKIRTPAGAFLRFNSFDSANGSRFSIAIEGASKDLCIGIFGAEWSRSLTEWKVKNTTKTIKYPSVPKGEILSTYCTTALRNTSGTYDILLIFK